VGSGDLVLDLGAGSGRLTRELARRGARVWAIELDPGLVVALRRAAERWPRVRVVAGDVLRVPLPREPFHVVSNPPFGLTTALLRRLLDDPQVPLRSAHLVLEWGAAAKRAGVWPSHALAVLWGVRYELAVVRRLPAGAFEPPPDVDAGVLRIVRRRAPLVAPTEQRAFSALVRAGFDRGRPLRRTLAGHAPPLALKRALRELGLPAAAAARDLDVHAWAALFDAVRATR
jgi:23S rRNA (adenine-N6)-dimethyltransferase